jgi:hypothetical protein
MKLWEGLYILPPMPEVTGKVSGHYQRLFPDRLTKFPPKKPAPEIVQIPKTIDLGYDLHYLQYEAESLFWVLLFWCMTAQPHAQAQWEDNPGKGFGTTIPAAHWNNLVGPEDVRHTNFIAEFASSNLHPAYSPFYGLIVQIGRHLRVDPELSSEPLRKEPEYLHEVLQRLIINFLVENAENPFMDIQRSEKRRKVDDAAMSGTITTTSVTELTYPELQPRAKRSAREMENEREIEDNLGSAPVGGHDYRCKLYSKNFTLATQDSA